MDDTRYYLHIGHNRFRLYLEGEKPEVVAARYVARLTTTDKGKPYYITEETRRVVFTTVTPIQHL